MAIRKTIAGTFEVDFRDQRKKRIQKTFDTHREAVAYQKESLAQVEKREYVKPSTDTVKEIAEQWHSKKLEAGTYKRSSLTAWKNHVQNFIVAELGTLKIGQLDVEAVEKAAAKWQERTSAKTVNKILTTPRRLWTSPRGTKKSRITRREKPSG